MLRGSAITNGSAQGELRLDEGGLLRVLVLKVINEVNNWQACARFLADGKPLTNIRVSSASVTRATR
jgi:hypothetical protein